MFPCQPVWDRDSTPPPPTLPAEVFRDEGRGKEMKRERKDSQDESGHAEKKERIKVQE